MCVSYPLGDFSFDVAYRLEGREGLKDLADSEDVAAITDFLKDFS